jgi:two-component system sensor histidine kinase KdpD
MPGRRENWLQQLVQYLLFTLAALALTYLYYRMLKVNQTTVALSFLILILFTAFRRRLAYSIYLSVLCTLLYNYFFLPPVGTFQVADPQNFIALVAFLAAAVSVNQVSARERRQAAVLATHQSEVEKLYEFSQRLMLEDRLQELSQSVPALVAQGFNLRAVALYLPQRRSPFMWDPEHFFVDIENIQADEVVARTMTGPRGSIRVVPLMLGLRPIGALAMAEGGYSESFYDAIGSLTAIIIERASALERNSRQEAAREGEILRAALLDSITHELRTPLTGISMAATTLLTSGPLDEASRLDLTRVISEESMRLNRLIDEAVVMAQLSAGEVHVRRESWNIAEVIHAAVDEVRPRLRNRQIDIDVAPGIPRLPMDADLMRRVWKHLIENALQYSPEQSPIRLSASLQDGRLVMKVQDEGTGVAEEEQPLIFERFFRGANRSLHAQGTGMGLAIVKAILEAHQGEIRVQSVRGKGTTFVFWIPCE